MNGTTTLVDVLTARKLLDDRDTVVVDCWRADAYDRIHIAGAIHLDHDYWLKQPTADGGPRGVSLLPVRALEDLLGRMGISRDHNVITYDDNGGRAAARVWWILQYLGHRDVAVLDGGWHAWFSCDGPVSYTAEPRPPTHYSSVVDQHRIAEMTDVMSALDGDAVQLVDARSHEEWCGEDSHGNRRAGHLPGAKHLAWNELITSEPPWRFRPAEEIRAAVRSAGIDTGTSIITYCQGGVRAAHLAFALELIGAKDVRVYDGSMAEWANRRDTPLDRIQP